VYGEYVSFPYAADNLSAGTPVGSFAIEDTAANNTIAVNTIGIVFFILFLIS